MANTPCNICGGSYYWEWEDAFNKFGFGDGDFMIQTDTVALALENAGYETSTGAWMLHNTVINSIRENGTELIPESAEVGYDDPRKYLPEKIVQLLDQAFPDNESVAS